MIGRRQATLLLCALVAVAAFATVAASPSASSGDGHLDRAATKRAICQVFGARCAPALRVASCETGGTFYVRALGDAGERGLFQIHPVHFGWLDERRLFEARYNARIAYRLSRGGRNWSPWTCQP